jgi:hypothetical protein
MLHLHAEHTVVLCDADRTAAERLERGSHVYRVLIVEFFWARVDYWAIVLIASHSVFRRVHAEHLDGAFYVEIDVAPPPVAYLAVLKFEVFHLYVERKALVAHPLLVELLGYGGCQGDA